MSGNFDFPPASASNERSDSTSLPARFQSLRQVIQREREQTQHRWAEAARQRRRTLESQLHLLERHNLRPSYRRSTTSRNGIQHTSTLSARRYAHNRDGSPLPQTRRPRQFPRESSTGNQIYRAGGASHNNTWNELSELDMLGSNPIDAGPHEPMLPNIGSLLAEAEANTRHPRDDLDNQPSAKRRRVEPTYSPSPYRWYGYEGQVNPGQLDMELVSCDGGLFKGDYQGYHQPENVLRDDLSVYCTERSACNLMLCHPGEASFTLEKITIKSPETGYTSPVQEGLLFVSMSAEELIRSANNYAIAYDDTCSRRLSPLQQQRSTTRIARRARAESHRLTLLESLSDPELLDLYDSRNDDGEPHDIDFHILDNDRNDHGRLLLQRGLADPCEYTSNISAVASPLVTTPHNFRAPTPPPAPQIRVTTDLTERFDTEVFDFDSFLHAEDGYASSQTPQPGTVAAELGRTSQSLRRSAPQLSQRDLQDRFAAQVDAFSHRFPQTEGGRMNFPKRAKRRTVPSNSYLVDPDRGHDEKHIKPHVQFFIPEDKRSITIQFNPPISSKFVLLRLWSPVRTGNIDVQSVVVHGWAGPRFFPSEEFA